jgi:hypothetical protein
VTVVRLAAFLLGVSGAVLAAPETDLPRDVLRTTPTARWRTLALRLAGWLALGTAPIVALAVLLDGTGGWTAADLARGVLLAAPLVAAAAVAFAYGPAVDPAYEAVAVTPLSPVRALLVRLAAVLVANALLAGAVDLALGDGGPRVGWLLPMTAAALLAVLVASRWTPIVGAVAGMGAWLLVLAGWAASSRPVAWLTGPGAQAAYAIVALVLLALLVRSGGPPGLGPARRKRGDLRCRATSHPRPRRRRSSRCAPARSWARRSGCTVGAGGPCCPSSPWLSSRWSPGRSPGPPWRRCPARTSEA